MLEGCFSGHRVYLTDEVPWALVDPPSTSTTPHLPLTTCSILPTGNLPGEERIRESRSRISVLVMLGGGDKYVVVVVVMVINGDYNDNDDVGGGDNKW